VFSSRSFSSVLLDAVRALPLLWALLQVLAFVCTILRRAALLCCAAAVCCSEYRCKNALTLACGLHAAFDVLNQGLDQI
jgi:hypothetical protein